MKQTALFAALLITAAAHAQDEAAVVTVEFADGKCGQFAFDLLETDAPATSANFKKLALDGYYENLAFHRAFPSTLVQVGDPLSKRKDRSSVGTGGPGYTLRPEIRRKHVKGAVAAARLGDKVNPQRLSNGSQFFVCLKPIPDYDSKYTVFGQMLWGYETLEKISNLTVDTNDYPVERVTIEEVKIVPKAEAATAPAPAAPKKSLWKKAVDKTKGLIGR